jgi:hypothetical protein
LRDQFPLAQCAGRGIRGEGFLSSWGEDYWALGEGRSSRGVNVNLKMLLVPTPEKFNTFNTFNIDEMRPTLPDTTSLL